MKNSKEKRSVALLLFALPVVLLSGCHGREEREATEIERLLCPWLKPEMPDKKGRGLELVRDKLHAP